MDSRMKARVMCGFSTAFIIFMIAVIAGAPFFIKFVLERYLGVTSPGYIVGFSIAFCAIVIPLLLILFSLRRIFSNIACGIVYDKSNVDMLMRISVWSIVMAGLSISGFALTSSLFGIEAASIFLLLAILYSLALALASVFRQILGAALAAFESEGGE